VNIFSLTRFKPHRKQPTMKQQLPSSLHQRTVIWLAATALCAALAACGGGQDNPRSTPATQSAEPAAAGMSKPTESDIADSAPPSEATLAWQREGARLNTAELQTIAETGVLPQAFEGPLLSGAAGSTPATLNQPETAQTPRKLGGEQKSAPSRVPVYRFFNPGTGAHFFTTSTTERDNVINNVPALNYEGPAFHTSNTSVAGLSPVHRFYNNSTGVHFYTISESERASVAANLPQFSYEGIGYYVLAEDWRAERLPHTGVTAAQCLQPGNDTFHACADGVVQTFNNQQDGHRVDVNPMSYSAVNGEPLTNCVRDNITGLIWEGKTSDGGLRDSAKTYTNTGVAAAGDTGAHVAAVNSAQLCGRQDWRLPTPDELVSIVNYGSGAPALDASAFPNTAETYYWTNQIDTGNNVAWAVGFQYGERVVGATSANLRVRLVSGSAFSGPRYTYSTVPYGTDASNNVVNDAKTGLQWRRCSEGQVWNGNDCSGGSLQTMSHEASLTHSNSQTAWRLPNVKELSSLTTFVPSGGVTIDATAFPQTSAQPYWSSSPVTPSPDSAWRVDFTEGLIYPWRRTDSYAVRLVRNSN
jgi:hypothetical protein